MNREGWIRAGALYFPLVLTLLACALSGRQPKQLAACLLGLLWTAPSLLMVQRLNQIAGWWSFEPGGIAFGGVPLELYLGWVVMWGALPQIALRRVHLLGCTAMLVTADLLLMPALRPVIVHNRNWLTGEAAAVAVVLLPALCIGRWTMQDAHVQLRGAMQVAIAGMLFLYLIPEITFRLRPGRGWKPLLDLPGWERQLLLQGIALLAIPGVNAVMEFVERGEGTPIPYDPPKRLVTSGIYRYCANPMQVSCAAVMLAWSLLLRNGWLVLGAGVAAVYSAGLAEWDERQDLAQRFGDDWRNYRAHVKNWRVRWRPYVDYGRARVFMAATCGPCSEMRAWLESREPVGLEFVDAETLPAGSIVRMRYQAADGSVVEGVRALGRALEHIHLGWALVGMTMRLPLVWQGIQLVMDASGLGPRIPIGAACTAARADMRGGGGYSGK